MKIGLIGYGKMGKAIEEIAFERGHTIAFRVNSENPIEQVNLSLADVAIEFSQPVLAFQHIEACVTQQLPIVVGTTAWQEQLPEVIDLLEANDGSLLHSSNFSIGVNIFFQLNEHLAQLMSPYKEYEAEIEEIHHIQKLDAPSGTAVVLADGIVQNNDQYASWICSQGQPPVTTAQQLGVTAIRLPDVPGTHIIRYTSEIDTITITHEAHNRKGFALGAVLAAEFLVNKKGLFTMRDVLSL
ncbi:MAG: 4-hydroxy-tetrahydrodipicolinate reductase [Candidatus Fluviicola riflensis]|nr:MAG: 4-hydroxy-tetrahydrodipicolinate reductase [Candidatus Fluviicola riflensis]OGS79699.1 MAG: 4-hydroxy-tetrahydrodipicolinate reductase [Candidatus Fluviicola riflensis]OGS87131.1 MAG: 4-hydroxy-tetrahydrodipicolinate reductase [Fluviicola sp. RIFCSPHIGHO2_01_FULL_43_53]OGS89920.1 MAG: 4-hydroxy-tetrahydrodipicolinate reductase [Fluviicola sp. RIFCSPHIGHO2_12_FULL_43_24]